jgi:hypothetical protein
MPNQRLERLYECINITDVLPLHLGTNDCPMCGGRGKLSVREHYLRCWRSSCEWNNGRSLINAVMDVRHQDYITALMELEEQAGLNWQSIANARSDILSNLLMVYKHCLMENNEAIRYLTGRGFSTYDIERSEVGYAPASGVTRLYNLNTNDLIKEGLVNNGKEFFYNRIIFPIYNQHRHLVHLIGRHLGQVDEHTIRYKDTTGGAYSSKHYLAFEHYLQEYIKRPGKELYVCEGYPDAWSLVARGVPAVGLLGLERLTLHARKLENFKSITFLFDSDRYDATHPTYPLAYKSWLRILPQLVDLQCTLPTTTFYKWLVPTGKDVNEWICTGVPNPLKDIREQRIEFTTSLLEEWGSDINQHINLIKLMIAKDIPLTKLTPYINPSYSAVEYAAKLFRL